MTKGALLFSNVPRILWDQAWTHKAAVKRHLPSAAKGGFKSPLHMISGNKVSLAHLLPFGSLLYMALKRTKFVIQSLMRKLKLQFILEMDFMKGANVLKDTHSISDTKIRKEE